jgi:hypothetical protein
MKTQVIHGKNHCKESCWARMHKNVWTKHTKECMDHNVWIKPTHDCMYRNVNARMYGPQCMDQGYTRMYGPQCMDQAYTRMYGPSTNTFLTRHLQLPAGSFALPSKVLHDQYLCWITVLKRSQFFSCCPINLVRCHRKSLLSDCTKLQPASPCAQLETLQR